METKAVTTMSMATTATEHLSKHVISTVTASTALVNLLDIVTCIVHFFLFLVSQNSISLSNFFKLMFSFVNVVLSTRRVLIRMPLHSSKSVSFLYLGSTSTFINTKNIVVVLTVRLLDFKFCLLNFLLNSTFVVWVVFQGCSIHVKCFLKFLFLKVNISFL